MIPFRFQSSIQTFFVVTCESRPVSVLMDTRSTARCGYNDRVFPLLVKRPERGHGITMTGYNPEPYVNTLAADIQWDETRARAYARTDA